MQRCAAAHAFPHAPQFMMSALVSRHIPPQSIVAVGHVQTPATQLCIGAHAVPHAPQFIESVWMSVHTGEPPAGVHTIRGALQVSAHEPLSQNIPPAQTVPHAPQLFGSLRVSTQ
jgi:hypothetical protein